MTDAQAPELIPVEAVAKMLSISPRQVWRMASAGELPKPVKLGRLARWRRLDLEKWINAGCRRR